MNALSKDDVCVVSQQTEQRSKYENLPVQLKYKTIDMGLHLVTWSQQVNNPWRVASVCRKDVGERGHSTETWDELPYFSICYLPFANIYMI